VPRDLPMTVLDAVLTMPSAVRRIRRLKAAVKLGLRRLAEHGAAARAAVILGTVGLVPGTLLLFDDGEFRAAYLIRPSAETVTVTATTALGNRPPIKLLAGVLSLSGRARSTAAASARVALRSPVVSIDLSGAPSDPSLVELSYLALAEPILAALSPLVDALQTAAFETLTVRDGVLILELGGGRSAHLTMVDADVTSVRGSLRIKGSATFRGEPVRFDATLGIPAATGRTRRVPVRGRIESALGALTVVEGRLDLDRGVALSATTAEVAIADVRRFARWMGHTWPTGPGLLGFTARGPLDWSGRVLTMSRGHYTLDGGEASGTLAVTLDSPRALLSGTLAFGTLDLAPHVAAATASPDAVRSGLAIVRGLRDVRWPLLDVVEADLRLSAEQVRLGPLQAGRSAATVSLRDGALLLNVAEVLLPDGGRIVGEIGITTPTTRPAYVVRGRADDVDLADVTTGAFGAAVLRGRGHVAVDLAGGGVDGGDLLSSLAGHVEAGLADGGTAGCSLAAVRTAMANPSAAGNLCRMTFAIGPTAVAASIGDGQFNLERAEATAGDLLVRLTGTYGLLTDALDLAVTVGPAPAATSGPSTPLPAPADRDVFTVRGHPDRLTVSRGPL
jgi:hypothetical protein